MQHISGMINVQLNMSYTFSVSLDGGLLGLDSETSSEHLHAESS